MSEIVRPDGARIHYETHGTGFPVLLLAPGGVSSQIESWDATAFDPVRELAEHFQVIAMDQRHAGRSAAPALPFRYEQTVGDQLAVLDAVGADRAHVFAAGSGCAHALRLVHDAPERVAAVVCQEPAGRDATNTIGDFFEPFDEAMRLPRADNFDNPDGEGMDAVVAAAERDGRFAANPGAGPFAQRLHDEPAFRTEIRALRREKYISLLIRFRDGIWPAGPACFAVPDEWLPAFPAPLLVVPGRTRTEPETLGKRLAAEVPGATLCETPDPSAAADFLRAHTPS
ncbi:alpha/beta fold hydrolase [Actinokineospora sp.]|uniref:alpha/beta fold hydrolase n=1 Tax=Actinokineospora sp. TaxID=1872133 RepID=UPI004037A6FC